MANKKKKKQRCPYYGSYRVENDSLKDVSAWFPRCYDCFETGPEKPTKEASKKEWLA